MRDPFNRNDFGRPVEISSVNDDDGLELLPELEIEVPDDLEDNAALLKKARG